MRPGSTVALSPVLTNEGSVNATAIIRLIIPVVNNSPAYEYTIGSGWTGIESDPDSGVYVYGYGSNGELNEIAPGDSTDPLTGSFTMKSSITGAEFNAMGSIDISVDGYLVDSEAGTDPVSVWGMVQ